MRFEFVDVDSLEYSEYGVVENAVGRGASDTARRQAYEAFLASDDRFEMKEELMERSFWLDESRIIANKVYDVKRSNKRAVGVVR